MMYRTAAELIEQFPWLNPREDWSNDYLQFDDEEDTWTELDDLPEGWKEGFLEDMLTEIDEVLNEYDCVETYRVIAAANRGGIFKWEHAGFVPEAREDLNRIIKLYKKVANETCMECGMRAKSYQVDGDIIVACDIHKPDEADLDVLL